MNATKTAKSFIIMILIFLAGPSLVAQETTILDNFTINKNGGKIYLNWVITSGNTCDGTIIYRSDDMINFTQIGHISGICGSSYSPVPYDFIDENPLKNQRNYYRLELGNNGFSEIVSLESIDFENKGYQVRPNPVITHAKIYFENKELENHQLKLYNQSGFLVSVASSSNNYFEVNAINLQNGIYIFTIFKAGKLAVIKGRLLIQH
ncbi:MAG: hypothetical protein CVT92_14700 [Bacteroidetes bacterium HGW-Bacteroidetes-1]|jgi:hypothetical protein|nr:MAG: hypothetical protein CVT92_14700 [Bacteroidetes bacterium HGW-Bacteroidetes-1]